MGLNVRIKYNFYTVSNPEYWADLRDIIHLLDTMNI